MIADPLRPVRRSLARKPADPQRVDRALEAAADASAAFRRSAEPVVGVLALAAAAGSVAFSAYLLVAIYGVFSLVRSLGPA